MQSPQVRKKIRDNNRVLGFYPSQEKVALSLGGLGPQGAWWDNREDMAMARGPIPRRDMPSMAKRRDGNLLLLLYTQIVMCNSAHL